MLCDEIVAKGFLEPHLKERDEEIFGKITFAQKFMLAPDFAQACDELTNNLAEIVKTFPFVRLPYKSTWIEVAQSDRPRFVQGRPPADWQIRPVRVGYLLEATKDDLSAWKAHLFWNTGDGGNCCSALAGNMDVNAEPLDYKLAEKPVPLTEWRKRQGIRSSDEWLKASVETRAQMMGVFAPAMPDYGVPECIMRMVDPLNQSELRQIFEALREISAGDWSGEPSYLLATLAMLNARNVPEVKSVDNHAFNVKRVKHGRLPLFSHKVLTIHARQKARMRPRAAGEGEHAEVRRHFVRGHWKVCRTGIFFWRPFMRGQKGFVEKEYKVSA